MDVPQPQVCTAGGPFTSDYNSQYKQADPVWALSLGNQSADAAALSESTLAALTFDQQCTLCCHDNGPVIVGLGLHAAVRRDIFQPPSSSENNGVSCWRREAAWCPLALAWGPHRRAQRTIHPAHSKPWQRCYPPICTSV